LPSILLFRLHLCILQFQRAAPSPFSLVYSLPLLPLSTLEISALRHCSLPLCPLVVMGFKHITIYAALLAVDQTLASHTLVQRAAHSIHQKAIRHTHNLAQDLRVAFGTMLVPRANVDQSDHVVYCKSGMQTPFGSSSSSGGNATSAASPTGSTGASATTSTKAGSSPTTTATTAASPWNLVESHQGQDFFNGWSFFTGADPTNGIVTYVDQNTATSSGLASVNSQGHAIMQVDATAVVANTRNSVRITTQSQYNGGLFIMDSVHMPTGCGIWPAFWTNGPNWPVDGEIDIVEGVNNYTNNQATVHTNVGCTLASTNPNTLAISGSVVGGTDCAALTTGNQGCGIRAATSNSFGSGFNSNGGGVYAMVWDASGIAVYFFPANFIPSDITAGAPLPDSWGAAQARWPATSCAPFQFFVNHSAIFDTTLCGDWASGVWNSSGIPGQEQSCAARTGVSTCEAFVRANGGSMSEAYWEIRSVKIYQTQSD